MRRRQFLQLSAGAAAACFLPWGGPEPELVLLSDRIVAFPEGVRHDLPLFGPVALAGGWLADRVEGVSGHGRRIAGPAQDMALHGGRLYVSRGEDHCVEVFSTRGDFLGRLGHDLNFPRGLALDRHGDLHVVDAGHGRVQVYRHGRLDRCYGDFHAPRALRFQGERSLVADATGRCLHWFREGREVARRELNAHPLYLGIHQQIFVTVS